MKNWVSGSKAKITDLFKSKKHFLETMIKFLGNPAYSLATSLVIMTMLAIEYMVSQGTTSSLVVMLFVVATTWVEYFTSWKKKLDQQ